MTVGVYGIFDSKTDECLYIGMSKNTEQRWKQHLKELRNKCHKRKDFVEWYHANGADPSLIAFRVLEECEYDENILNICEIKWFNLLNPKYYGKKPSVNEKWTLSEETRRKQSEAAKRMLLVIEFNKICKICSKNFIGKSNNALYCSDECREMNNLRKSKGKSYKIDNKPCIVCKVIFRGRKYSKKCNSCREKTAKSVC